MLDLTQQTAYHEETIDSLKEKCLSCQACELASTRTNVVFGNGPTDSNLMIIGEGPGEKEDLSGNPFVGRAGQLLTKILESVGINRETDSFITNIVKCRPPENRNPKPAETEACKGYLLRQIQLIQPKVIVLLGAPALKTILQGTLSISKSRGQWFTAPVDYMEDPVYIMPIFHPSYLLRNASKNEGSPKWLTWNDMKEVKAALGFYDTINPE